MSSITVTKPFHIATRARGRRELEPGAAPAPSVVRRARVPRVARLMALAIELDGLIASGAITDQASAARAGHVTRARLTQVLNLCLLAPDLQLEVLGLPSGMEGRDEISETDLRRVVREREWGVQRGLWLTLVMGNHEDGATE